MANDPIGARLKKARLEKGISLEDAHNSTKIHLDVLRAIEDDNFIEINPVYLKGFLKIYCGFLDVELPENIARKNHTRVQVKPQEEQPRKARLPRTDLRDKIVTTAVGAAIVLFAAILVFASGKLIAGRLSAMKQNRQAQSMRVRKPAPRPPVKRQSPRPDRDAAKARAVAKKEADQPVTQNLRLGVRALEDCWLQLKSDNRVVFQNILKKGRFESWEANDRMDLTLGSAGSVQLELNGKIIPPLGKRGQVLKNIVITRKDGLQVGK